MTPTGTRPDRPSTSDNSDASGSHQDVTKWSYNADTG